MNCYRVGVFRLGFCSFISVGAEQLHLIVAGVLVKFDRQNSMDVAESSSAASAANNSSRNNNSTSSFFFPPAAQPEVMRAAEKDEYYVASLCDACHEAFRHAMGTRLAVAYQNETKLAGRVLYYLLTTGAGLQTLGEEYCDISQVMISTKLPATPARRTLLVFYQTVLPYLTERLSARAAARGNVLANQEELRGSEIIGLTQESTSEIVVEDGSMIQRRSPIQIWRSWSERVRQRYNAGLQQWPVVRKLTYHEVFCNIDESLVLELQRV